MILFRPIKGSLSEAMQLVKEFETENDMKDYISKRWGGDYISFDDIIIDDKSFDESDRNGWKNTKYVLTKTMGDTDCIAEYGVPQCIGYCATEYDKRK